MAKQQKPTISNPIEWFDDRFYKVTEGENEYYLPSVTTILNITAKPYLARWRGDVGNEVADKRSNDAKDKGRNIHQAINHMLSGGFVAFKRTQLDNPLEEGDIPAGSIPFFLYDQDEYWQVFKFVQWLEATKATILDSELTLANIEYGYAGTLDLAVLIEEGEYDIAGSKPLKLPAGRYIVDVKTGKQIDDDYFLQLAAYRELYVSERMKEVPVEVQAPVHGLILHTNAETKAGIEGLKAIYRSPEELTNDFTAFLEAWALWRRRNATMKPTVRELPRSLYLKPPTKEE